MAGVTKSQVKFLEQQKAILMDGLFSLGNTVKSGLKDKSISDVFLARIESLTKHVNVLSEDTLSGVKSEYEVLVQSFKAELEKQSVPVASIKVWSLKTVQTRYVASELNNLSRDGNEIFSVYPSASVGGSYEVLSYKFNEVSQ